MRLFVGIMLMQFGIRHLVNFTTLRETFPAVLGMGHEPSLTRLSIIPPIVAMLIAEYHILHDMLPDTSIYAIDSIQPGYLPLMFIGIFLFLMLSGPGKISVDYCISLFIVARHGKDDTDTEELEEV